MKDEVSYEDALRAREIDRAHREAVSEGSPEASGERGSLSDILESLATKSLVSGDEELYAEALEAFSAATSAR